MSGGHPLGIAGSARYCAGSNHRLTGGTWRITGMLVRSNEAEGCLVAQDYRIDQHPSIDNYPGAHNSLRGLESGAFLPATPERHRSRIDPPAISDRVLKRGPST